MMRSTSSREVIPCSALWSPSCTIVVMPFLTAAIFAFLTFFSNQVNAQQNWCNYGAYSGTTLGLIGCGTQTISQGSNTYSHFSLTANETYNITLAGSAMNSKATMHYYYGGTTNPHSGATGWGPMIWGGTFSRGSSGGRGFPSWWPSWRSPFPHSSERSWG